MTRETGIRANHGVRPVELRPIDKKTAAPAIRWRKNSRGRVTGCVVGFVGI
jgi:hypothetical protein